MFTERELRLLVVLVSDAIEDTTITLQQHLAQIGVSDLEMQAYLEELRGIERQVVRAIEQGTWAPELLDDDPHAGAEEQYEPTEEDLAELDATYDGHDCAPSHESFPPRCVGDA